LSASESSPAHYSAAATIPLCQVRYSAERLRALLAAGTAGTSPQTSSGEVTELVDAIATALRRLAEQDAELTRTAPGYAVFATLARPGAHGTPAISADAVQIDGLVAWSHRALAGLPRPPRRC